MTWNLPTSVNIDGVEHKIRNNCDYRVILDVIGALKDEDLEPEYRTVCALYIFYEDFEKIENPQKAVDEMMKIIACGEHEQTQENKPILMDWEHDFPRIAPPISRVLGYEVRTPQFTHWYTFVGAYSEIGGDCTFANIVSIRNKKAKRKKLEKWEEEFYRENRNIVDLPQKLTSEEQMWLNADW